MKMKNLIILGLSLVLLSCSNKDKITGKWERVGDEYQGLRINTSHLEKNI
jgi:hypothetical protein